MGRFVSTVIGTLAAIGISAMKKKNRTIMLGATNIPLLNADIVTGISMMLLCMLPEPLLSCIVSLLHSYPL